MNELLAELGDPGLEQIAGMLGADPGTARGVIQAAGALVVAGMARGAEHPESAEALRCALDEHVDTDPFNGDVASLTRDGQHILAHVLGVQGTEYAAVGLSHVTGVGVSALMRVLPLLAPMIMSLFADRADAAGMSTAAMAAELRHEHSMGHAGYGDLIDQVLGGIFGDRAVPAAGHEGARGKLSR